MVDVEIIDAKNDNQVRPSSAWSRLHCSSSRRPHCSSSGLFSQPLAGRSATAASRLTSCTQQRTSTRTPTHTQPTQSIFVSAGPEACCCHKVWPAPLAAGAMRGMPQQLGIRPGLPFAAAGLPGMPGL